MNRLFHKKDILTIPNCLSLVRLLMIPVILWQYIGENDHYGAIGVIILSGLTDVADGWIARKFNMVSDFGKILDPVADKLTQAALILCLTTKYDWMFGLIIFFAIKECIMAVLGYMTIRSKDQVNSAKWHGKLNTVVLYSTMIVLILIPGLPMELANMLILLCGAMMFLSLVLYIRFYMDVLGRDPATENAA